MISLAYQNFDMAFSKCQQKYIFVLHIAQKKIARPISFKNNNNVEDK